MPQLSREQRGIMRLATEPISLLFVYVDPVADAYVETIRERHLVAVLIPSCFSVPFLILGFHGDNDSGFLNRRVAQLKKA